MNPPKRWKPLDGKEIAEDKKDFTEDWNVMKKQGESECYEAQNARHFLRYIDYIEKLEKVVSDAIPIFTDLLNGFDCGCIDAGRWSDCVKRSKAALKQLQKTRRYCKDK